MMTYLRNLLFAAALVLGQGAYAQDLPQIRAATLKIGTVNWELSTIKAESFDRANGFELVMQPYADNGATRVAFEGGRADLIVADWIWTARQRAAGRDYVFLPYSKAVGGLVVPADSTAQSLADLAGGKIGIAGGPLDKSWLILRAYAASEYGLDLTEQTEQVYAAPPLIYKTGLGGETQGSVNYWHYLSRMKAEGMRELISVSDAAQSLGLNPDTPLLGYVLRESFVAQNPGILEALHDASRAAKDLLASDDAVWDDLRPVMRVDSDAEFIATRDDFRAGIPPDKPVDREDADRFLQLMARLGGEKLVGKATSLPDGLFVQVD